MSPAAVPWPRAAFPLAALATSAITVAATPSLATQLALLVPLVAVLGVPHGALDIRMASRLWPLERTRARLAFGLGYLAVAAAVLGLWLLVPGVALVAFLLYSAAHFAGDWRGELPLVARLAAGAAVVALPAWRFEGEVAGLFAGLGPAAVAEAAAALLHVTAPWAAAVAGAGAIAQRRGGAGLELTALVALAIAAPPLIYFVVYFCGLHSPRHFVDTLAQLGLGRRHGVAAALPLTAATLAGAGIAAALLLQRGVSAEAVALETVFIGLAALAVPHMLLVERFWTRREPLVAASA